MSKSPAPAFETTIEVRDACLCLHVQRAARALARRFDAALRPVDLTSGQFSLLMSLNRPKPATINDVAMLLAMDRTTVTAMLKPLQRRRLVSVRQDPDDRRNRLLRLTSAGGARLAAALPLWRREQAAAAARLGEAEAGDLRAKLRAVG